MATLKFFTDWAPVAKWPQDERVTPSQSREALSTRESRYAFAEWRKRHDETGGTRGETVPRKHVIKAIKDDECSLEFLSFFQPDKWTTKLSITRLVYLLYRIHTAHPDGLFYNRSRNKDMVLNALLDLVFHVRNEYCPSKRSRSALVALVLPNVKHMEKQKFDWPRFDWSGKATGAGKDDFVDADMDVVSDDETSAETLPSVTNTQTLPSITNTQTLPSMTNTQTLRLDPEQNQLLQKLTSVPKPEDRRNIEDQVRSAIQCRDESDPILDLPTFWSSGPSLKDACAVLHIDTKEPFHLPGTTASQTLPWYQVKGIAHIKICLLKYNKAALLDFMGLGKTRQSLVGLEIALSSSTIKPPRKPSLIIVPSGTVGEHWINEGIRASKRLFFVAVGDGFSRDHQHSPRVQYWRVPELMERGLKADAFVLFVCTFATIRNISDAAFVREGFHAIIVDEMQQLRKWKGSATFLSVDKLQPTWRLGLTATPFMNGLRDMKGFLAFFRDRRVNIQAARSKVARAGKNPFEEGGPSKYQTVPEMWEQYVENAELHIQEKALRQVAEAMPFVISRNLRTPNDDESTTIGASIPPLYVSRQTAVFGDPTSRDVFTEQFNKLLRELWKEENGRKFMQMHTLTNLATLSLSTFAAQIPADKRFVQQLNAEAADLAAVCGAVLERRVADDEALELVRSPKLDWLAVFIGRTVVERGEKVLLFVLNNREQLLVSAFLHTLGLGPIANFHSGLNSKERSTLIDSFNGDGPSVFVTTWEMGSVGFNLQKNCRIAVALSLYYNRNAEMQGRARVHRPGQKRPVLYVQCRQSPSLDTVFMLKHADRKELVQLYAQLQLAKKDQKNVDKILDAVSNAMAGLDGADMQNALDLELEEDVAMPAQYVETLQTILAKDSLEYYKSLEEL